VKRQPTQQELEDQLHSYFVRSTRLSAPPSLTGLLDSLPPVPESAASRHGYPAARLRFAAMAVAVAAVVALIGLPFVLSKNPVKPAGESPSVSVSASPSAATSLESVPSAGTSIEYGGPTGAPATANTGPAAVYIDYTQTIRADQSGTLTVSSPDTLQCTVVVHAMSQTFQTISGFNIPARTAKSVSFHVAGTYSGDASLTMTCSHVSDPGRASDTWELPFTVTPAPASPTPAATTSADASPS
jgi:hypothetical protein